LIDPHFRFESRWALPHPRERVWDRLHQVEEYPRWWPWLESFRSEGLAAGSRTEAVLRAPLRYSLRFTLTVLQATAPSTLVAEVRGDIEGRAQLWLDAVGSATRIRILFDVELCRPILRAVSGGIGHRVLAWGHNHVMDHGVRRFEERALRG